MRFDGLGRTTAVQALDGSTAQTLYLNNSHSDGVTPALAYTYGLSPATSALSVGRLTQVQTGGITTRTIAAYDAMGRVLSDSQTTDSNKYPFSYSYNLLGRITGLTYPSGRKLSTSYNAAGRVCTVGGSTCSAAGPYAGSIAYAENGALQQYTLRNGLVQTTTFNNRFQPTTITAAANGTQLLGLTLGYPSGTANNGNLISAGVVTSGGLNAQQVFTYDAYNRLSLAAENPADPQSPACPDAASTWCQSFGYDQFGNRAVTAYAPQVSSFLNPNWTPSSIAQFNGSNQWTRGIGDTYDGAGNLTSLGSNGSPTIESSVFSYDAENRMISSNVANTGVVNYVYDGDGKRVEKVAGTTKTVYVYDAQGQLEAEYSTAANPATGTEYLTTDQLGTTRLVTDANRNVIKRYDFVPFGEEVSAGIGARTASDGYGSGIYPNSPDLVSQKFTGKERDSESGLDYFGARYYGSAMGRFTSPDEFKGGFENLNGTPAFSPGPIGYADLSDPQTLNMYVYTRNNPLKYIDPDGHDLTIAPELVDDVLQHMRESPSFNAEMNAHVGLGSPDLIIQSGPTPNDPSGQASTGNTSAAIGGGPVNDCSPTCVTVDRPYTYKGATVTINTSVMGDKDAKNGVLDHETGHVHDARTNTQRYQADSQHTKDTKGKTPHDSRPEEQRANQYKDTVKQERQQWRKEHCHGVIHQTCS